MWDTLYCLSVWRKHITWERYKVYSTIEYMEVPTKFFREGSLHFVPYFITTNNNFRCNVFIESRASHSYILWNTMKSCQNESGLMGLRPNSSQVSCESLIIPSSVHLGHPAVQLWRKTKRTLKIFWCGHYSIYEVQSLDTQNPFTSRTVMEVCNTKKELKYWN